eukprot:c47574_g1_i1.p1 GENE.c47574_g1_i1~~c47574_g1_i1.p1  ORF type:complete len:135 (+),score=21.01 c47574_g1_i1:127-531(+)
MAEAILRATCGHILKVASAGTRPTGAIHVLAKAVMAEIGIDLDANGHRSKNLDEFLDCDVRVVITVDDANEACPAFKGRAGRHHWAFDDPAAAVGSDDNVLECFRRTRDELRRVFEAYAKGCCDTLRSLQCSEE